MIANLLALGAPQIIIIVLVGIAAGLALFGFLRRFSRMSWAGLQVALLFACTFFVDKLPTSDDKIINFIVAVGAFLAAAAIVLGLGMIFRAIFRKREASGKKNFFFRLLDRLLGAVNAILNVATYVVAIGGFALTIVYYTVGAQEGVLQTIYTFAVGDVVVWDALSQYMLDFVLTALFVAAIKGGYRLGLFRSIWAILVVLLLIASMFVSMYLAFAIPFLSDLAQSISASMVAGGNAVMVGNIVGYFISTAICFVACVLAIVLFSIIINLIAKIIEKVRFFRWMDGVILTLVFFAITVASVCVGNLGITYLSGADFAEQIAQITAQIPVDGLSEQIVSLFENMALEEFATSSQFAKILYENNPILALLG